MKKVETPAEKTKILFSRIAFGKKEGRLLCGAGHLDIRKRNKGGMVLVTKTQWEPSGEPFTS